MRLIDWGEWEEGNLPGDIERDPYSSFKLVREMAGETEAELRLQRGSEVLRRLQLRRQIRKISQCV